MRKSYRHRPPTASPRALPEPRAGLVVTLDPLRIRIVAGDAAQERKLADLAAAIEGMLRERAQCVEAAA